MTRPYILASIGLATLLFAGSVPVATTAPAETHALVEMSEHCLIGGVPTLRLAPSYPYVAEFVETLRRIRRLRSPFGVA